MNAEAIIDTNVLVYAYDSSEPEKQAIARRLLMPVWKGETCYAVSLQILGEFVMTLTKKVKNKVPPPLVSRYVKDMMFFSSWTVLVPTPDSFIAGVDLSERTATPFWDAQIAALAKSKNIQLIYTENEKDFADSGLQVVNPFKE